MKISKVIARTSHISLKKTYDLSFTSLNSFQSNIVEIQVENNRTGLGEVTALPGYGFETHEQIDNILNDSVKALKSKDESQARYYVDALYENYPFSASAIGTALDFAYQKVKIPRTMKIPLLATVSASNQLDEIEKSAISAYENGYRTLKVKIGKALSNDIDTAKTLLNLSLEFQYRFDANQGYNYDDVIQFLMYLEGANADKIELLEQPFNQNDWNSMEKICRKSNIPLMLDESIYSRNDIKRASEIGCSFVKLKLCKSKGISHLIRLAKFSRELGLKVVLGNGVTTDIGNYAEAIAFSNANEYFSGAFEGNGFLKMDRPIGDKLLKVNNGYLRCNTNNLNIYE